MAQQVSAVGTAVIFSSIQCFSQYRLYSSTVRESSKLSLISWCVNNMTLCHNTSTSTRQTRTGRLSIRGEWSCRSRGIISRALNYTTYALIQHICSLYVADFQQICSDYAVNFWKTEKLWMKNWQSSSLIIVQDSIWLQTSC